MSKILFIIGLLAFSFNVFAEKNLSSFNMIPIMHEGRIKPLSTFSRLKFEMISGKDHLESLTHDQWLAELLFDPEKSYTRNVFKIDNDDVKTILNVKNNKKYFNFIELYTAFSSKQELVSKLFESDEDKLDLSSKKIRSLYTKFSEIMSLSRSFSMLFKTIGQNPIEKSYYELIHSNQKLNKLELRFEEYIKEDSQFNSFPISPPGNSETSWKSPWEMMTSKNFKSLENWNSVYLAYFKSSEEFNLASRNLVNSEYSIKFKIENLINQFNLVNYSIFFSVLTAFSLFFFQFKKITTVYKISFLSLILSFATLTIYILSRCYVLSRPPVSNLYESIVFVSATSLLLSILYEFKYKNQIGLFIGSVLNIILLFLSIGYKQSGDNLTMVVAVLDTNFWLATHVLTISIGYGTTLVASLIAHIYLFKFSEEDKHKKLFDNLYGLILFSFLFTCLGTILGGIWADQSWGRFWGWDPKENGALLICLWLIFITHGKIGNLYSKLTFSLLAAVSSCIVIIAWFGVNLLNVGLHSYGFSNDTAIAILVFCLLEISIAVSLYVRARKSLM